MSTKQDVQVDSDIHLMLDEIAQKAKVYNLILFNDDHHDMMQVARQLMKAVKCTRDQAVQIMMEAHMTGQAIALAGSLEEVKEAGRILEEIDLAIDIIEAP